MNSKPRNMAAAKAEELECQLPQYGRVEDVQRHFGLSPGTIYNLLRRGRIRGCSLPVTGKRSRIRLIDIASERALVEAEINQQNKGKII